MVDKFKFVGDLVRPHGNYHDGYDLEWRLGETKIGIVTDRRRRWSDQSRKQHQEEMVVKILFVETGEEEEWSEWDVELISEGK